MDVCGVDWGVVMRVADILSISVDRRFLHLLKVYESGLMSCIGSDKDYKPGGKDG